MEGWREVLLQEVAAVIDSLHKTPQYSPVGFPMVRVTDIKKGKLDLSNTLKVDEKTYREFSKKHEPSQGDIVFSRVGSYGVTSYVKSNDQFCLGQNTAFIIPKENAVFLYYYLNSPTGLNEIEASVAGSTQATISLKSINNFNVRLPSASEQQAIAAVLSSLDDKIDLLHRQNKTLEALAQTLFRQWFVEEADEGGGELEIENVVTILGGTTPSTKKQEYWNGEIHWTSPRDLSNSNSLFLFDTERMITQLGLEQIGSGLMPKGTVLMSSRAPIGYLTITNIEVAINQGYIAMVCGGDISNNFIYLWCKQHMDEIKNAGNGSTFEEISKSNFKSLRFVMPPKKLLKQFDKIISVNFQKILKNQTQIRTLTKLRDTLLPKLMSGEVRVEM